MNKTKEENEVILGQQIGSLWTIGSWYANGYVDCNFEANSGENFDARIHLTEILKIVGDFAWEIYHPLKDNRKKHIILKNPIPHDEGYICKRRSCSNCIHVIEDGGKFSCEKKGRADIGDPYVRMSYARCMDFKPKEE